MSEKINGKCICKSTKCTRHGKCEECIKHHKGNDKLPYCKRPGNKEAYEIESNLIHKIW